MKFTIVIASLLAFAKADEFNKQQKAQIAQSIAQTEAQFDDQNIDEQLKVFHQDDGNASDDDEAENDDDDDNLLQKGQEGVDKHEEQESDADDQSDGADDS